MMFGPTKGEKFPNIINCNVISANLKTQSVVYGWLRAHAVFGVTCFPPSDGASDVISRVLSIC